MEDVASNIRQALGYGNAIHAHVVPRAAYRCFGAAEVKAKQDEVRPGRYCMLPHRRVPFISTHEGSECVSMTWRACQMLFNTSYASYDVVYPCLHDSGVAGNSHTNGLELRRHSWHTAGDMAGNSRNKKRGFELRWMTRRADSGCPSDQAVARVVSVLQLSNDEATQLLRAFKWSVNRVQDAWFEDEEGVRAKFGLIPAMESSESEHQVTCGVCFDEFPATVRRCRLTPG